MATNRSKDRAPEPGAPQWRYRKVNISDLVLPVPMRGREQPVRFNLELTVGEEPEQPLSDDIANVVSYAGIVDGIRETIASHADCKTETLAEAIAAMALTDRRVTRVRVAVDLLDASPAAGAIGVEILRSRSVRHADGGTPATAMPWVVKLGGSLARSPRLGEWLQALATSQVSVAVVPGGGAFADQVRESQNRWRFGDAAAHHMALLAMDQMGRMFAALEPSLRLCAHIEEFHTAYANGESAVWLPSSMTLGRDDIEESWDVTSDSLAAWLAGRLGAGSLLLVKSAEPPQGRTDVAELARCGLVDPAFARHLADSGAEACCVGPDEAERTVAALAAGELPGCRILAAPPDCPRR